MPVQLTVANQSPKAFFLARFDILPSVIKYYKIHCFELFCHYGSHATEDVGPVLLFCNFYRDVWTILNMPLLKDFSGIDDEI